MADTVLDTDTLAVGVFVMDSEGVETDEDDATGDTVKLDEDDFDDAGDGDVDTLAVFDSVGIDETDAVTDTVADDEGALEMVGREEELGDPLGVIDRVATAVTEDVGDVDTETVDEGDVDPDRVTVGEPELV